MNATATAPIRGTIKAHRDAGTDLNQPFLYFGEDRRGPAAQATRYERIEVSLTGTVGYTADGSWKFLGGRATKFWAAQAEATPAAAEGDELDGLKFAELMTIAKALKVPGRGTARIDALRAGIRVARAAR